jgi:hypothetical protein
MSRPGAQRDRTQVQRLHQSELTSDNGLMASAQGPGSGAITEQERNKKPVGPAGQAVADDHAVPAEAERTGSCWERAVGDLEQS